MKSDNSVKQVGPEQIEPAQAEPIQPDPDQRAAVSEQQEEIVQAARFVVKSERLNLRNGPGHQFGVVDVLQRGTVVEVHALPLGVEVPGWELVSTGDSLIGWVARPFIETVEE